MNTSKGGQGMREHEIEAKMDELAGVGNWGMYSCGEYTVTYENLTTGSKTTFNKEWEEN